MNTPVTSTLPFPVESGHDRRPIAGRLLSAAGHSAMNLLVIGCMAGVLFAMDNWGSLAGLLLLAVALPLNILAIPACIGLIARGRQMRALPADELVRRRGAAPVVLLRSFTDDDLVDPSFSAITRIVPSRCEDLLVKALSPLGPAVALGRPGEKSPQLGAARLYVRGEYWQRAIAYFMERAVAVVAVVGGSPGLWWEIELAIQRSPMERLLFFFPYPAPGETRRSYWRSGFLQNPVVGRFFRRKLFPAMDAERQARYSAFRQRVNPMLPHPLPEVLGDTRFITFSQDGRPILIKPAKPSLFVRAMTLNLNPRMDIPFKRELRPFVENTLNALNVAKVLQ